MSPEDVICNFVSFELMIKESTHIINLEQGATATPKVQPVAFKATEEKKMESTPSSLPMTVFFFKQKTPYEIRLSLVGSEMCIRNSINPAKR